MPDQVVTVDPLIKAKITHMLFDSFLGSRGRAALASKHASLPKPEPTSSNQQDSPNTEPVEQPDDFLEGVLDTLLRSPAARSALGVWLLDAGCSDHSTGGAL